MKSNKKLDCLTDRFTNRLDEQMLEYVSRFVEDDMSSLEKAISIYLCLGDVLCYSPSFCLTNEYNKTTMARDINLDNNEIICRNWAVLYSRLLKHYGLRAKVDRNKGHHRVKLELDDILYTMDATALVNGTNVCRISDLARIKSNMRIQKFCVAGTTDLYDPDSFVRARDDLNSSISNVYVRQNRKLVSEEKYIKTKDNIFSKVVEYGSKVGLGSFEDVQHRVDVINKFRNVNLVESVIEKSQIFNDFYYSIFADYASKGFAHRTYNVYANKDNKLIIYKLLAFEIDGNFYYFLDDGQSFSYYTRDELLKEFSNRRIMLNELTEILGLLIYTDVYKYKKY